MYFWNISKLENDLIEDRVTQRELLFYTLALVVVLSIAFEALRFAPTVSLNAWDYLNSSASLVIGIFGTFWIFQCNGGDSGKQFVERYLTIMWVMSVRFLVYSIPIFLLLSIIYVIIGHDESQMSPWDVIAFTLFYLGWFWRVGVHMRNVAEGGAC